ncbi:metallophosphoesterase [Paenibacillus nasutitermitis]|uniref:Phosphoesterase n=1 Tax=Paenibacillus nasutitermitis TaxID=1652958 RepID=A0A916YNW1_9BACL|nr:metallophosphoesterase [Paenibacillus nasutitermitis]GGD54126.1 phosphoesterase [Paenibacillus nasutitermitis]
MVGTIIAVLGVFIGLQWYIGWNGSVFLSAVTDGNSGAVYWVFFWLIAFSYIISRLLERLIPGPLPRGLKWIGSYWFAVFEYSVLLLPVADLIVWILLRTDTLSRETAIIAVGSAVLAILAAILARGSWNAWNPVVRHYSIVVNKQAGQLKQLRIAAASDLHLGTIVGTRYLKLLVERVNQLKPDIVLLPGDVIDDDVEPFRRLDLGSVMKGFKSRFGTYAVLGNHEYIGGKKEEFIALMAKAGIPVLTDQTTKIADSFYLVGRKDKAAQSVRTGQSGRLSIKELIGDLDQQLPLIMLDHQPSSIAEAADNGIDVSLHGHTHRGQMAPNHLLTRRIFELDWGYLQKGKLHAIVSSGYGTWGPPIRIGSRSEIVDITISFEPLV